MTGLHAAVLVAKPDWMLSLFDSAGGDDVVYWLRRYGIVFVAITIVFWFASNFSSSVMQRPILWGAAFLSGAMAVLSVVGILDHQVNNWFAVVAAYEVMLAVWFGWLLSTERV
jgi:hypothetical protein